MINSNIILHLVIDILITIIVLCFLIKYSKKAEIFHKKSIREWRKYIQLSKEKEDSVKLIVDDLLSVLGHNRKIFSGYAIVNNQINSEIKAFKLALKTTGFNIDQLNLFSGILIYFISSKNLDTEQISVVMNMVYEYSNIDADILFGTELSSNLKSGDVKIAIILTEDMSEKYLNNIK